MSLNKLENFIRSTDGRIIFVNPSDINSTDAITNDGTSLISPFKTIQRALLESARFSYQKGNDNDLTEKTTILLFPGEHTIDNRPGFAIYNNGGAKAVSRGGSESIASSVFSLQLNSIFDLSQENNILYKFNSYYGGVVVPRGTSIVSLDLRKTKIRPKYVPNPTDPLVQKSAIFRITGACYFWQFSLFDADPSGTVYTNPDNFTEAYQSTPTFSHHKLTCFEFCDGVNTVGSYGLTDLDMYYAKVSNAFNAYRDIDQKFPDSPDGFAKQRPEWEIVGAFAPDAIKISSIISGNGATASSVITVTTNKPHELNAGTPIKIKGVSGSGVTQPYNISTQVQTVLSPTVFTYLLPGVSSYPTLNASPSASAATVTIETDTVSGASPYIFNCSLRSVWGMNGLHADGSKASGFRSTVVAQFTAVSLQKDDRAFAKYDQENRIYNSVDYTSVYGSALPTGSSQTDSTKIYHLDPDAIYRQGWESSHIKITNDAFIQIVSVFAIGFNKHFDAESGADASITNSNSNFGQISLNSSGFKKDSFDKDDRGYITSIIPPRAISTTEDNIEWLSLDVGITTTVGISSHLYLYGFTEKDSTPSAITQGYRIGARLNDKLYVKLGAITNEASIYMCNNEIASSGFTTALGTTSSVKSYDASAPVSNSLTIGSNSLITGEKIKIISDDGDLPENITEHETYYAIKDGSTAIKLASSYTNATTNQPITIYGGSNLHILSRVSDKNSGELGSPIQYDPTNGWFIHVNANNQIYNALASGGTSLYGESTDLVYVKRISDERSLDEKLYKIRVVIPKELANAKDPESGFVIQESKSTGARSSSDFTTISITNTDYDFNRNLRLISNCSVASNTVTITSELPHNLQIGDIVYIKNVKSSTNTTGEFNLGFNGRFAVTAITNSYTFQYSTTDVTGIVHSVGTFTNTISTRDENLPRFERNDWKSNLYVYRNEIISPYIYKKQDGIYHLYVLNASNQISTEFTNLKYSQLPVDLYPQLDRDNVDANPYAAKTYAKRSPIGAVVTNDLKKSITRESADLLLRTSGIGLTITSVSSSTNSATITFSRNHNLAGISKGTLSAGANYTSGTYYNVKLLNGSQTGTWNGATAKVVVDGSGSITSATIMAPGSGYSAGDLYFDQSVIGAGNGNAIFTVASTEISNNVGDVIQFTGDGTKTDGYYRITSIPAANQVSIAKTSGDLTVTTNQYGFVVSPSVQISGTTYNSTTGTATFTTSSAHGLLAGNRFTVVDSSNNNLGNYLVKDRLSYNSFTVVTNTSISATSGYILKHGLSSNEGISDIRGENFGSRGVTIYQDNFVLGSAITDKGTVLSVANASRLLIGSYIQIDNEIMRVISGNNTTTVTVIRGVLGTRSENHDANSMIREIKPFAIDLHRPSILRASGHTFEYLGYGPGNYSTGLPQVQVKTLNDQENFLANSQERSGGVVVYNGLNNNGDLFNGNTKTSATSGEVISYDIPKPTVTGEDPNKLSVVFDEVTVKERLLVEGGTSGAVLSQFNGPVTFNKEIRSKGSATFSGSVRLNKGTQSTNTTTGDLIVSGGVGVGKNLNIGGDVVITGNGTINGELTINTGIVPDSDEGAYLGTAAKPFSDAHIGEIRIAQTDDNTIDTVTGNLKINATTGSSVAIQTSTTITGNLDLTGSPSGSGRISANYLDVPNVTPISGIIMWPGGLNAWPTDNWKLCNGQAISRTTYSTLYGVIGTSFGAGDGSTTFNLPNLLERFVVGAGGNNPTVSGGTAEDSYNRGDTGGSKDAVVVSHGHISVTDTHPGHKHVGFEGSDGSYIQYVTTEYNLGSGGTGGTTSNSAKDAYQTTLGGAHSHNVSVTPEGVSGTNANLPPYIALYYIIRIQ
jgi:microcystin-dependent protein